MRRRQFLAVSALGLAAASRAIAATPKLRVAVIGHTGRGNFGHDVDKVWLGEPEVEVVAVADADPTGLAAVQKRLKLDRGFADYRQMLSAARPDIVAVSPRFVDEHHDMILAAIDSGARGIYVEKPFCRTPAEADAIVAGCEKK
ncbi:MAG TPA: Gfo/Idh/MocA family oxidoreductase, partial [Pirellulales bacterium]|nr:Gfo/Idh/MocA family oxidoreductase [Pirellulales bacterium]